MAVTRGATVTSNQRSVSASSDSFSHTVDANTTLLIITVHIFANESVSGTPTWNTSENFTLIDSTTASGVDLDTVTYVYGLVSPTATTANISVSYATNTDCSGIVAINYIGTETASVAAATNFLSEDVNNSAAETSTNVHGSAGTAGNALLIAATAKGGDLTPASNASSFVELFDNHTGGTAPTTDASCYVADLLDSAPSAITVTWSATDSNSSTFIEIVASSSGNTYYYQRNQ